MEERIQTLYAGRYLQNEATTRSSHHLPRDDTGFISLFSAETWAGLWDTAFQDRKRNQETN